jgi:hypothetical protein
VHRVSEVQYSGVEWGPAGIPWRKARLDESVGTTVWTAWKACYLIGETRLSPQIARIRYRVRAAFLGGWWSHKS